MDSSEEQPGTSVPPSETSSAGGARSGAPAETLPVPVSRGGRGNPPPPPPSGGDEDDEEGGMLRMSFLEHLEELRSRLIRMVMGIGVAFVTSLFFSDPLWRLVAKPATTALKALGY